MQNIKYKYSFFPVVDPGWGGDVARCGSRGGRGPSPHLTPNFEAQSFATTVTPLHAVGKISLGPLLQILDQHLNALSMSERVE